MTINFIHSFLFEEPPIPDVEPIAELDFTLGIYKLNGIERPVTDLLGDSPNPVGTGGTFRTDAISSEGMLMAYLDDDANGEIADTDQLEAAWENRPYAIGDFFDALYAGLYDTGLTIVFEINYPVYSPSGPPMYFMDFWNFDDCSQYIEWYEEGIDDYWEVDIRGTGPESMAIHKMAVTISRDIGGGNREWAYSYMGEVALTQIVNYDDPFGFETDLDLTHITIGHDGDWNSWVMDAAYIRKIKVLQAVHPEELPGLSVFGAVDLDLMWSGRIDGKIGMAFEGFDLQGIYGNPPYAYSITSGTLPPGLSFNATSGTITGTPTTIGETALSFRVTDDDGNTADVGPLIFGMRETYISLTDPNRGSTNSNQIHNNIIFGPEADDRIIAVCITGFDVTSMLIDGLPATKGAVSNYGYSNSIWYVALPTGTTGSVFVGGGGNHTFSVYNILGLQAMLRDSDSTGYNSTPPVPDNALTLETDNNGMILAVVGTVIDDFPFVPGPVEWTGANELNEQEWSGRYTHSVATKMTLTAESAAISSTGQTLGTAMAAVSFMRIPPAPVAYLDFVNGQYYAGGAFQDVEDLLGGGFDPASIQADGTGMAVIAAASNEPDAIGPLLDDIIDLKTAGGLTVVVELGLYDGVPSGPLMMMLNTSSALTATEWIEARIADTMAPTPDYATVLLIGANGTDASTAIVDESVYTRAMTVSGNAQIDTAQSQFGGSSLLLDGSGDRISTPDSTDWNFSSGQFTVEMWIRPNSVSGTQFLVGQWQSSGNLAWIMFLNGAALSWNVSTTGSDNLADLSGGTVVTGSWQHIAVSYDGSKYRAFLNGTMVASSTTARTIFNSANVLSIGSNANNDSFWYNGWIDELRISKGVSRYSSDSGFTVPASQFPRESMPVPYSRALQIVDDDGLNFDLDTTYDFSGGEIQRVAFTLCRNMGGGSYETAGCFNAVTTSTATGTGVHSDIDTVHLFHVIEQSKVAVSFKVRSISFYAVVPPTDLLSMSNPPLSSDPYYNSNILLLGFNEYRGTSDFLDEGPLGIFCYQGGSTSAVIDTAQRRFGRASVRLFPTSGTSMVYASGPSSNWVLGTQTFTIEGWYRFASHDGTVGLGGYASAGTNAWLIIWDAGSLKFRGVDTGAVTRDSTGYAWIPTLNTWYHIAVDRDSSGNLRIYVDGVMVSKTTGYTHNLRDVTANFAITGGIIGQSTYDMHGWTDDYRYTRGVARYASDAGFTRPWGPFPRGDRGAKVTQNYLEVIRSHEPTGVALGTGIAIGIGSSIRGTTGSATGRTNPLQPIARSVSQRVGAAAGTSTVTAWAPIAVGAATGKTSPLQPVAVGVRAHVGTGTATGTATVTGVGKEISGEFGTSNDYANVVADGLALSIGTGVAVGTAVVGVKKSYTTLAGPNNANMVLSNGNLTATHANTSPAIARSPDFKSGGKWYFEVTTMSWAGGNDGIGVATSTATAANVTSGASNCAVLYRGGGIYSNGSFSGSGNSLGTVANGTRIGVAWDADYKRIYFRKNGGNWNGSTMGDPEQFYGGVSTTNFTSMAPFTGLDAVNDIFTTVNFGATPFVDPVPFGFQGWLEGTLFDDPQFANVAYLMSFEGTDGAQGGPAMFSIRGHGGFCQGTEQVDTAQKKFGGSSMYFGAGASVARWSATGLTSPNLSPSNTSPYTIECWIRFASLSGTQAFVSQWSSAPNMCFSFRKQVTTNELRFQFSIDGTTAATTIDTTSAGLAIDTWYHMAVDKDSTGKIRIYIDGVMKGSATPANSIIYGTTSVDIGIGGETGGASNILNGWIDEVRITKGFARYASDAGFTPPTEAFPRS